MSERNVNTFNIVTEKLYSLCKDDRLKQSSYKKELTFIVSEGIPIFFDKQDLSIYNSILRELVTMDYIKTNYALSEISSKISYIINQCLALDQSKRKEYINNEIKTFKINRQKEIKDFTVYVPIINLELKRQINVGNVKIFPYTNSFEQKLLKLNQVANNSNPSLNDKMKDDFAKNLISYSKNGNNSRNLCYAEVCVKCFNRICDEKALNEVRTAINVLKLYWEREDENLSRYFGIKGETIDPEIRCIPKSAIDYSLRTYSTNHVGSLDVYHIDKNKRNYMRKNGFNQICEILLKSNKNEIEISLINAIYWYGESTNIQLNLSNQLEIKYGNLENFQIFERFLKLFIALESLLILSEKEDNNSITNNLSERAALLLSNNKEEIIALQKEIKDLYNIRSEVVHGGKSENISKLNLYKLQIIVQQVIIHILKNKENLIRKDDFMDYFNKIKSQV